MCWTKPPHLPSERKDSWKSQPSWLEQLCKSQRIRTHAKHRKQRPIAVDGAGASCDGFSMGQQVRPCSRRSLLQRLWERVGRRCQKGTFPADRLDDCGWAEPEAGDQAAHPLGKRLRRLEIAVFDLARHHRRATPMTRSAFSITSQHSRQAILAPSRVAFHPQEAG